MYRIVYIAIKLNSGNFIYSFGQVLEAKQKTCCDVQSCTRSI